MSAMQRRKGTLGERQVATIYREHGIDVARVPNSGGLTTKGDVVGVPGCHVEVKMCASLRMLSWLRQCEDEAPEGLIPALHFRQSSRVASTGWYVAVPLDDFVGLLQEAKGL